MAVVTKAASSHTAVTTGWTSPSNAFASTGDNVYASAAPGKSLTVNGDFGFAFALSDFTGAANSSQVTISQIVVTVEWKVSVATLATLGVQLRNQSSGTLLGTETTDTTSTADTQRTQTITSGITAAELISGQLAARIRDARGNTNTAHTGTLDFVKVDVTYTVNTNTLTRRADMQTATDATLTNPTVTINKPSGTVSGDVLVAFMETGDQTATGFSPPDGTWTQQYQLISTTGGGQILAAFTKTAGASEPTSYSFSIVGGNTTGNNESWCAALLCYTDTNGTPTVQTVTPADDTLGPSLDTPSITPSAANALVVSAIGQDQSAGTAPSFNAQTASSGNSVAKLIDIIEAGSASILGVFEEQQTTAAATVHTVTYSGAGTSTRGAATGILAVIPAQAGLVSVTGLGSAQSFGTLKGNIALAVSGLASAQAFGAPTITGHLNRAVSGLGTAQSFGTVTAVPGGVTKAITGLASATTFGAPSVSTGATFVNVTGLASAQVFGTLKVNRAFVVSGVNSAQLFGTPTAAPGAVSRAVSGLASGQSFGVALNKLAFTVNGLGSAQLFGAPAVTTTGGGQTKLVSGLGSAAVFGVPISLPGPITAVVGGLPSAQFFGAPLANQTEHIGGLASAQVFGTVTPSAGPVVVLIAGIPSAQVFGSESISGGAAPTFNPATMGHHFP